MVACWGWLHLIVQKQNWDLFLFIHPTVTVKCLSDLQFTPVSIAAESEAVSCWYNRMLCLHTWSETGGIWGRRKFRWSWVAIGSDKDSGGGSCLLYKPSLWRALQHGEDGKDGASESTCQWVLVCSRPGDLQDCRKNHHRVWRGNVLFKVGGGQPPQTAGRCQPTQRRSVHHMFAFYKGGGNCIHELILDSRSWFFRCFFHWDA